MSELWHDEQDERLQPRLRPGAVVTCEQCDLCGSTDLVVTEVSDLHVALGCPGCGNSDLAIDPKIVQEIRAGLPHDWIFAPDTTAADAIDLALDATYGVEQRTYRTTRFEPPKVRGMREE